MMSLMWVSSHLLGWQNDCGIADDRMTVSLWHWGQTKDCIIVALLATEWLYHCGTADGRMTLWYFWWQNDYHCGTADVRMTVPLWHWWRQNDCGTADSRMTVSWWDCWWQNDCVMVRLLMAEWLCHGGTADGRMTVSWWDCWWQNDCVMVRLLKAECVTVECVTVSWWDCWWQNDCVMVGQLEAEWLCHERLLKAECVTVECVMVGQLKAPCVHHGVVLVVLLCLLSVHPSLFLLSSCFVCYLLIPALFLLSSCFVVCWTRHCSYCHLALLSAEHGFVLTVILLHVWQPESKRYKLSGLLRLTVDDVSTAVAHTHSKVKGGGQHCAPSSVRDTCQRRLPAGN